MSFLYKDSLRIQGTIDEGEVRSTLEIDGGLRVSLKLCWDYPPLDEEEEIDRKLNNCLKEIDATYMYEWSFEDPRRHTRFAKDCDLVYVPMNYPRVRPNTKMGRFLWHVQNTLTRPDKEYLSQLENAVMYSVRRLEREGAANLERIIINECLLNLNWLTPYNKHKFIRMIAQVVRRGTRVLYIAAENAQLWASDSLRLLLAFSLGAGTTLEELQLWNFSRHAVHPIRTSHIDLVTDPFTYDESEIVITTELQQIIWNSLVMPRYLSDLPDDLHFFAYYICLQTLQNLHTLSVQYSWLSGGQGANLCHLACVKNGRLKNLNLLCTYHDLPEVTQRVISPKAWKYALSTCPKLRVNMVTLRLASYDYLKQILTHEIPLESFHMSSGYPSMAFKKTTWWIGSTTRTLIQRYKSYLKKVSLHLWHPRQRLDSCLCSLLTDLHYLEEFDYMGPFDRLQTIEEIVKFYKLHETRMKRLYIYVQEDPCNPQRYRDEVERLKKEHWGVFVDKGIDFELGTMKL